MPHTTPDQIFLEEDSITKLSSEKLVETHEVARHILEQLDAQNKIIRDELYTRIKGDGEVIGNYGVTKAMLVTFPDVTIEQAMELGATKAAVDQSKLKELWNKGIKIPAKETHYVRIREVTKTKDIDVK